MKKYFLPLSILSVIIFLSGCIVQLSSLDILLTEPLNAGEEIHLRFSDGSPDSSYSDPAPDQACITNPGVNCKRIYVTSIPTGKTIVGAYITDNNVSWVPSYAYATNGRVVEASAIHDSKPEIPAQYYQLASVEPSDVEDYSKVTFNIHGMNNSDALALVDGRTEVFALASAVTFYNYDEMDTNPQSESLDSIEGGFSSFTTDGQVVFLMKTEGLELEQLTLHSGPTLLQELPEEVHVTYNGNGAEDSVPSDSNAYFPGIEDTVEVLGVGGMTKTGHSFTGWNATGTVSEAVYEEGDTFTISEDTTLYAVWTPKQFKVTYNGNGDDGTGTVPSAVTEDYGSAVTVSGNTGNLAKENYSFAGWNTAANGSGDSFSAGSSFTIPAADTTLYAQWEPNEYTVTYNGNGDDGTGAVPSAVTEDYGSAVTLSGNTGNLVKEGYSFAGWNTAANGSGTSYNTGASFTIPAADTTLYAQWTINEYTVTYNGNGDDGTGTVPSAVTEDYGSAVTVSGNTGNLVKEGYSFAGWNTAANGSGTSYNTGASFTIPAADTTLYAQWNSGNAMLGDLSVSPGTLDFNPSDLNYTVDVGNNIAKVDIFITKGDPTQTLMVTDAAFQSVTDSVYHYELSNLVVGENPLQIQVSAQDGTQNDYNLTIQRLSNNADLSGLTLSNGTMVPVFADSETSYTTEVSNHVDRLTITPTFADVDASATVSINGGTAAPLTDGTESGELALDVGVNTIAIAVTAEDGTPKTYTIAVTREGSGNADLSGLTLSNGTLTPAFAASEPSYTAEVRNSVRSLTITAMLADVNASATVSVNGGTVDPLTAGTASGELSLNVGVNSIEVLVTAQDSTTTKTYTIEVTRARSSGGSSGGNPSGGAPSGPAPTDQNESDLDVTIDGETEQAIATATASEQEGQAVLTVIVDAAKLTERLTSAADQPVVTIPVAATTDKVMVALTGETVKVMENKQATLDVRTPNGSYTLPASEVAIEQLAEQLGAGTALENITVHVDIAKSGSATVELLESAANEGQFTVVVPPVDFTVTAEFNEKAAQVTKFNAFVEREIPIPNGVDANMITAAVVLNEDGSTRSVPMKIVTRDGVSYAVINSLTNSTYAIVSYPVAFHDVANHWAKDAVNNMGSRMVISGFEDGKFQPDQAITRAEFAAIIIHGLGLKPEQGASSFSDVMATAWYHDAVNTAAAHGLIIRRRHLPSE